MATIVRKILKDSRLIVGAKVSVNQPHELERIFVRLISSCTSQSIHQGCISLQ